jgi:hypothetical protein
VAGAVFVGFQLYLYGRWLLSGPSPTPDGPTAVPAWMEAAVWLHIALGIPAALYLVYRVVVRPWRADRRLPDDALFLLAVLTLFWQDLLMNYLHYTVVYTTAWPNLGSWYGFVPGWPSPNGGLISSAAIFFFPMYALVMYGFVVLACRVLQDVHRRRPGMGKPATFGVALALALAVNLTLEAGWARLGLYVFGSTIESLTLFAGHYYQYPLYHCALWGASWAAMTVLRFYRDDRGLTAVERGVERTSPPGARRTALRFLALAGGLNVIFLGYNLATGAIHSQSGDWITDVAKRSYYTNGLCEPGVESPELDYV